MRAGVGRGEGKGRQPLVASMTAFRVEGRLYIHKTQTIFVSRKKFKSFFLLGPHIVVSDLRTKLQLGGGACLPLWSCRRVAGLV